MPDPSTAQGRLAIILNAIITVGIITWCYVWHRESK